MPPFKYPKIKHTRRHNPPSWRSYQLYKPILREEFEKKCVYCRLPDSYKGQDNFGVDHYKPKNSFPHLKTEYTNLFYSCNCCNRRKGVYWPDTTLLQAKQFIPNPCDHIMFDHLKYKGVIVEEKSVTGLFAIEILDLNDEASIEYRQFLIDILNMCTVRIREIEKTIMEIEDRIQNCTNKTELRSLTREKSNEIKLLKRLKTYLDNLSN